MTLKHIFWSLDLCKYWADAVRFALTLGVCLRLLFALTFRGGWNFKRDGRRILPSDAKFPQQTCGSDRKPEGRCKLTLSSKAFGNVANPPLVGIYNSEREVNAEINFSTHTHTTHVSSASVSRPRHAALGVHTWDPRSFPPKKITEMR